jgi:hypothetical protein
MKLTRNGIDKYDAVVSDAYEGGILSSRTENVSENFFEPIYCGATNYTCLTSCTTSDPLQFKRPTDHGASPSRCLSEGAEKKSEQYN